MLRHLVKPFVVSTMIFFAPLVASKIAPVNSKSIAVLDAKKPSDLREILSKLNTKDSARVTKVRKKKVSKWEASPSTGVADISDDLLNILYYMSMCYRKPLSVEKISARHILSSLYHDRASDVDKACIFAVMTYFDLLE